MSTYLIANDECSDNPRAYITSNLIRVKRKLAQARLENIIVTDLDAMKVYNADSNQWEVITSETYD